MQHRFDDGVDGLGRFTVVDFFSSDDPTKSGRSVA